MRPSAAARRAFGDASAFLLQPLPFLVATLLLATALRAYALDQQALRGDEGFGVRFVKLSWSDMFASMAISEPHPPLYFIFLKLWIPLAGDCEDALRWPSVLGGVVTTALAWPLARRWLGPRAARLAIGLGAFSPFLVWFGQDARMYTLLTALTLAALWHTWRAALHNRPRDWLIAGTLWLVGMFTHYFAAFPLAAAGLALMITPRTRARWLPALAMAGAVALGYLPWALYVSSALAAQEKDWLAQGALWRLLVAFSVGPAEQGGVGLAGSLGAVSLALLLIRGAWTALRLERTRGFWLLIVAVGVPALAWAIGVVRAVFAERFALTGLPVLLMLAALGADSLLRLPGGRVLQAAGLGGLALAALLSLAHYYFDPAFAKSPDWRGLARYLRETGRPDEVILVNLPDPSFEYYYRGPMPFEDAPPGPLAAVGADAVEAQLKRVSAAYAHVRFLFSPSPGYDPDGFVGSWLEACCEKTDDRFVARFRVQTYDTPTGSLAARAPLQAQFEHGIALTGYRFVAAQAPSGESLHLTLYWTTAEPVADSYTVFVHVLASDGFQVTGADGLPREGTLPTDAWAVGQTIIDPRLISLADLAPGDYAVEVGLYQLGSGQRLMVRGASGDATDRVRLPELIHVTSP